MIDKTWHVLNAWWLRNLRLLESSGFSAFAVEVEDDEQEHTFFLSFSCQRCAN